MAVERERGISVSSAVMSLEQQGLAFNLLDTPGQQDFSPMRFQRGHLPHPDRGPPTFPPPLAGEGWGGGHSTRQGGIEKQTRKLFEVCRLRDVPIITFVNKLDREGRDRFDMLDEIEQSLALDVTRPPGRSACGVTFCAPTTSLPMRVCCSSAVSTTGSRSGPLQWPRRPETAAALAESRPRQIARGAREANWLCPLSTRRTSISAVATTVVEILLDLRRPHPSDHTHGPRRPVSDANRL